MPLKKIINKFQAIQISRNIFKKRIYLDYASTTPLDQKVFKAMKPFFENYFANPSSLYAEGVAMRKIVDSSRKKIADMLHALPHQLTFTASGTESNNMALFGIFYTHKQKVLKPHFITSSIEHPSILEPLRALERNGAEVTYIAPKQDGLIDPEDVKKALRPTTVLLSIMYANNEIGTINPIKDIVKVIRKYKKEMTTELPYFHTDASQAANYLDLNVSSLNVDMMTLDASKIYGPKGIGMLYKRSHVELEPLMYGGSQEKGLRPGTEHVAAIVGLTESLSLAEEMKHEESVRLEKLRNDFIAEALMLPGCTLNGSAEYRLPNNINICIEGIDAEYAVFLLDAFGICISSVTSCRNLSEESSSYVVESIKGRQCASSSLRISLGRSTTQKDLVKLLQLLPQIIDKARKN